MGATHRLTLNGFFSIPVTTKLLITLSAMVCRLVSTIGQQIAEPTDQRVEDVEELAPDPLAAPQQLAVLVHQPGPLHRLPRSLTGDSFEMTEIGQICHREQAEEGNPVGDDG